jgi:CRP-like cAMP-binding protein
LGCFWYFVITTYDFHNGELGFFEKYSLDDLSLPRRLVLCCYFALTTLSTVGYGDLTPQSNVERIFGIVIMILGIALFSYIMGNFNDVLTNYDKQMGIVDKSADLQVWITSLTKFTNNQALPRELVQKIDEHFKFVWKNDRLSSLTPDDSYLKQMPKPLKHRLIRYLFDDIFSQFRGFLLTHEFRDSPFYYDLAFEMLPRKYDAKEMILKQGEPVHEIYLIKEGSVYIYFEHEGKQIGKYFSKGYFFGNYNIFRNVPAEFHYQAIKGTENAQSTKVLAIPKANLLKILAKYPDIFARMADNSKRNSNSLKEIMKHELKVSLNRQQTKEVHQSEIEDISKNCVTDKVKHSQNLLKEANKKANMKEMMEPSPMSKSPGDHTVLSSMSPSRAAEDPAVEFRKNVAKDLLDITNKLQKIRDKLSVREKKPDL